VRKQHVNLEAAAYHQGFVFAEFAFVEMSSFCVQFYL